MHIKTVPAGMYPDDLRRVVLVRGCGEDLIGCVQRHVDDGLWHAYDTSYRDHGSSEDAEAAGHMIPNPLTPEHDFDFACPHCARQWVAACESE